MKYYTITLHTPTGFEAYTYAYDISTSGGVINFTNNAGKRVLSNLPYIVVGEA